MMITKISFLWLLAAAAHVTDAQTHKFFSPHFRFIPFFLLWPKLFGFFNLYRSTEIKQRGSFDGLIHKTVYIFFLFPFYSIYPSPFPYLVPCFAWLAELLCLISFRLLAKNLLQPFIIRNQRKRNAISFSISLANSFIFSVPL